jgi:Ca-activated chloride channel homolog
MSGTGIPPGGGLRARGRTTRATSLAAILTAILTAGLLSSCTAASGGGGCVTVNVTVTPELVPAARGVAAGFGEKVRGHCVKVGVRGLDSSNGAAVLSGHEVVADQVRPDAWIPDSSLWIPVARAGDSGAAPVAASGTSVASSPLVFALSAKAAKKMADAKTPRKAPSWRALLPQKIGAEGAAPSPSPLAFEVADPAASTAGLGTLLAMHRNAPHGQRGLASYAISLYGFQFHMTTSVSTLVADLLRTGGKPATGVIPEQAVAAQNTAHPGAPLVALYPSEGTVYLDYPYVLTTKDRTRAEAAAAFGQALRSTSAQAAIEAAGLRAPDHRANAGLGKATGNHLATPRALALPAPNLTAQVRRMWNRVVLGSQMLVLLDVSPSMGDKVPGTGLTRIQAITQAARQGLRLYGPSTDNALWLFSTKLDGDRDYKQAAPLARLDAVRDGKTQRRLLDETYKKARPVPHTRTGLYDSILAAFEYMQQNYAPNRNNYITVFTDGQNYDPGAGISLTTLLERLAVEYDTQRPVAIIPIAFGKDIDPAALNKIASATKSQAFVTLTPAQIQQVFLKMLIRLTCDTDCPVP